MFHLAYFICCSVIGAAILSVGFCVVIWGKAKEEEELKEKWDLSGSQFQSNCKTPLLQNYNVEENNNNKERSDV